ncbi:MAG: twin-arginine translocation signal domain-containing protein, partial [Alphaproteobacteria bacterium]
MHVSRRNLFKYAAAGSAAAGLAALSGTTSVANAGSLGTLLDYAAGVPSAQAIKAAGYAGAIRYVSDRRPGADWMVGKPVLARET